MDDDVSISEVFDANGFDRADIVITSIEGERCSPVWSHEVVQDVAARLHQRMKDNGFLGHGVAADEGYDDDVAADGAQSGFDVTPIT